MIARTARTAVATDTSRTAETAAIRRALLRFYDRKARDLPWRRSRDPYAIWVSEIMLQQTRVDTVVPYYERFLSRFPTAAVLAKADEDAVMAAWSGLGYYRRARLLHRGVREVVERYGGQVPRDPAARLGLPGVGRYTAGAIGSIAFGLAEPLVDGNVARVFARLFGIDTPLGRSDTDKRLWAEAQKLVVGKRPGDLNQAIMELGATVCTKADPRCDRCPLSKRCAAHRSGSVHRLPVVRPRTPPRPVAMVGVVALTARPQQLWLVRRPVGGLFAGLWNLPLGEGGGRTVASALLREAGLTGRLSRAPIGELEHVLSHRRLRVELWRASGARPMAAGAIARSYRPQQLSTLGLSALTERAVGLSGFGSASRGRSGDHG